MAIVYLSLGSNLGDRVGYLQQATSLLSAVSDIKIVATSSFYESEPWQRDLNSKNYIDRTIDIDILFYDDKIINTPNLTIPHRFFHKRAFLMVPMLEIAQDFVHPLFQKTIETLYDELENPEMVVLYGTRGVNVWD